jgi:hypothetical protein
MKTIISLVLLNIFAMVVSRNNGFRTFFNRNLKKTIIHKVNRIKSDRNRLFKMKYYNKEKKTKKPITNEQQPEDWESGEVTWDFDENTLEKEENRLFNPFVYSYILF